MDAGRFLEKLVPIGERRYGCQRFVIPANRPDTLPNMVADWGDLGIVTSNPGRPMGAFPGCHERRSQRRVPQRADRELNAAGQASDPEV